MRRALSAVVAAALVAAGTMLAAPTLHATTGLLPSTYADAQHQQPQDIFALGATVYARVGARVDSQTYRLQIKDPSGAVKADTGCVAGSAPALSTQYQTVAGTGGDIPSNRSQWISQLRSFPTATACANNDPVTVTAVDHPFDVVQIVAYRDGTRTRTTSWYGTNTRPGAFLQVRGPTGIADATSPVRKITVQPVDPSGNARCTARKIGENAGDPRLDARLYDVSFSQDPREENYCPLSENGSWKLEIQASTGTLTMHAFDVDVLPPSIDVIFPTSGSHTEAQWNAGCTVAGFCGRETDEMSGTSLVEWSLKNSDGKWWKDGAFGSSEPAFHEAVLDEIGGWHSPFPSNQLTAGKSYELTVTGGDIAGNSTAPKTVSFTYDGPLPNPPTEVRLHTTHDTGLSDSDGITSTVRPRIAGRVEPGKHADLHLGGKYGETENPLVASTSTPSASGSVSLVHSGSPALKDGIHTFILRARDPNTGAKSPGTGTPVWIDTTPPSASSVGLDPLTDLGFSSTDGRTSSRSPRFLGRFTDANTTKNPDAHVPGVVDLLRDTVPPSPNGPLVVASRVRAAPDGSFAVQDPGPVPDGSYKYQVYVTDVAGNQSDRYEVPVTIESSVPPFAPTIRLAPESDSGVVGDNRTNAREVRITGEAPVDTMVVLSLDGVEQPAIRVASDGTWTTTLLGLSEGARSFGAAAMAEAGGRTAVTPLTVTIDRTAPPPPTDIHLTPESDSGRSSTDRVTNAIDLAVAGSAEPGSTVEVSVQVSAGVISATVITPSSGTFSAVLSGVPEGNRTISATATDRAGNTSTDPTTLAVTVDRTSPAKPAPPALSPGSTGDGTSTTNPQPTLVGTAEARSTVEVFVGSVSHGTVDADETGAWSFVTGRLAPGIHSAAVEATDAAGNTSTRSNAFTFTVRGETSNDPPRAADGYALVTVDGGVYRFGSFAHHGDMRGTSLNAPVIASAAHPGGGYWLVGRDGGVFTFGPASFHGSLGDRRLNKPVVNIASSPSGKGYWLVASDGGVFAFGDAGYFGSTGSLTLNKPIVTMAATATGRGYWLIASDGGVFAFGDAPFLGSLGHRPLNKPIVSMAPVVTPPGYWLVASDGGIFAFGSAADRFYGSGPALSPPPTDVVGIAATQTAHGYWIADASGRLMAFGDARHLGDVSARGAGRLAGILPARP